MEETTRSLPWITPACSQLPARELYASVERQYANKSAMKNPARLITLVLIVYRVTVHASGAVVFFMSAATPSRLFYIRRSLLLPK